MERHRSVLAPGFLAETHSLYIRGFGRTSLFFQSTIEYCVIHLPVRDNSAILSHNLRDLGRPEYQESRRCCRRCGAAVAVLWAVVFGTALSSRPASVAGGSQTSLSIL